MRFCEKSHMIHFLSNRRFWPQNITPLFRLITDNLDDRILTALPYVTGSWLIQTEFEPNRDQDRDKDQCYVEHFTLQLKQDQDHL